MARGRMISKSLGSSRKFHELHGKAGRLGDFAQLLFPLLVISADDFGRLDGDAFAVKHSIFPTSPHSEREFESDCLPVESAGLSLTNWPVSRSRSAK